MTISGILLADRMDMPRHAEFRLKVVAHERAPLLKGIAARKVCAQLETSDSNQHVITITFTPYRHLLAGYRPARCHRRVHLLKLRHDQS